METLQLRAEITPADQAEPVTWSSSDPDAAEVDRDTGLVTAGREPGAHKNYGPVAERPDRFL